MSVVIAFVDVLVMYSHAYQYLWMANIINVMPGIWYAVIAVLCVVGWIASRGRGVSIGEYNVKDYRACQFRLLIWAGVFVLCVGLSYLASAGAPEQLRALKTAMISVAMLVAFMAVFTGQREVRAARIAMTLVVIVSILLNVVDFSGIYTFSLASGRAAGMYVNPNLSALYLVLGLVLTVSLVPKRLRLKYAYLVGLGVLLTFSRSGVLTWLIALYWLSKNGMFSLSRRVLLLTLAGLLSLALVVQFRVSILEATGADHFLSENARQRLYFDYKTDGSVQGRIAVAERSWELIRAKPLMGHGIGAHSVWRTNVQPHNMFLLLGVELGVLGVLLYIGWLLVLWRKNSHISQVFVATIFVASLFSHNILDYPAIWLACALLLGIVNPHVATHGDDLRRAGQAKALLAEQFASRFRGS